MNEQLISHLVFFGAGYGLAWMIQNVKIKSLKEEQQRKNKNDDGDDE